MRRIFAVAGLFAMAISGHAETSSYLAPGPWAMCRATGSPMMCGFDKGQGTEAYQLFINSDSGPGVVAYEWTVTAVLDSGAVVTKRGVLERVPEDAVGTGRATATDMLCFGGVVHDVHAVIVELMAVSVRASRLR